MEYDHITYMRGIATTLKSVQHVEGDETKKHFFRVSSVASMDELMQNLSGVSGFNLIVENIRMGRLIDNTSENILDNQSNVFMLLKQANNTDSDSVEQTKKDCEAEAWKILAKMRLDRRNDHKGDVAKTGLRNMDFSTVYYQTVGPICDNMYGFMVTFNIAPPAAAKLLFNANYWI